MFTTVLALQEETRLAHQRLEASLRRVTERLDTVEPTVTRLDDIRQRGWAAITTVMVIVFLFVGGLSSGFRWLALKMGLDLP